MPDGEPESNSPRSLKPALGLIGSIIAPTSVLTGLALYFGWVRTSAIFAQFGIDQSHLKLSAQDYLLRSAGVLFRPIVLLLASVTVGLLCLAVIERQAGRLRRGKPRCIFLIASSVIGGGLIVTTILGLRGDAPPLLAAMSLGLAAFVLYCAVCVVDTEVDNGKRRWTRNQWSFATLAGTSSIVSLFWATAVYAQQSGSAYGTYIARTPDSRPSVVLYSRSPLHLEQAGIVEKHLPGTTDSLNYRYTGYRLLIYANDRWFLISRAQPYSGKSSTLVLMDDDSIRVVVAP